MWDLSPCSATCRVSVHVLHINNRNNSFVVSNIPVWGRRHRRNSDQTSVTSRPEVAGAPAGTPGWPSPGGPPDHSRTEGIQSVPAEPLRVSLTTEAVQTPSQYETCSLNLECLWQNLWLSPFKNREIRPFMDVLLFVKHKRFTIREKKSGADIGSFEAACRRTHALLLLDVWPAQALFSPGHLWMPVALWYSVKARV